MPLFAKIISAYLLAALCCNANPTPMSWDTFSLTLLGEGLVKKEIAGRLDISTHTVYNYMRRIYEKLQVPNTAAAISKAYKDDLFSG